MILNALALLKSLTAQQYSGLFVSMLFPGIAFAFVHSFAPDSLVLRVIYYLVVFVTWSVWAVLAVASMLNRDKSETVLLVDGRERELLSKIRELEEANEGLVLGFRQEVRNLEESVRKTLKEDLGVDLRPRRVCLRIGPLSTGMPTASMSVRVMRRGRPARLRSWIRDKIKCIWKAVYGNPKDK